MSRSTKRQRGLVGGGCELMGKKHKPPEDPTSKFWCMAWSEDDAAAAFDDLMSGEACVYITANGVYAATRYKRTLCKGMSGALKAVKDVEKAVSARADPRGPKHRAREP
jgi:hypothetical protein